MPNLKTDRIAGMALGSAALNVRRLMYQSLIGPVHLRNHASRLAAALHSEHLQGAANALVDGMRGNAEFDGDLLGRQMLVDEEQGVELALAQLCDAPGNFGITMTGGREIWPPFVMVVCEITLHQHEWLFTAKDKIKQKQPAVTPPNIVYCVLFRDGEVPAGPAIAN